mgnify:CR=1 FL=1
MSDRLSEEIKTWLFNKKGVLEEMGSVTEMSPFCPNQVAGKICYFTCGHSFDLPIRDVLNENRTGFKKEPSYETATYNFFTNCNQPSLASAVGRGVSHILFLTKYRGLKKQYVGRYFITGSFEIGWIGETLGRTFVKAEKMMFTRIEDAFEITPERWTRIHPTTNRSELMNLRYCIQTVKGDLFEEITGGLTEKNVVENYVSLVTNIYKG